MNDDKLRAVLLVCLCWAPASEALNPAPLGIPDVWNGDHYKNATCEVIQQPPAWVDGYLFAQTSGSYGDQSNPDGQKLIHLFDAISGVSVHEISPKQSTFTGSYYPTRAYKIWDFNDRDFTKSKIAWMTMYSDVNNTAMRMWDQFQTEFDAFQPNVDFWKIGTSLVAGTEQFNLGMTFDIPSIDNFRPFPFINADSFWFRQLIPLHMPMHEHVDPDTHLIWHSVTALNITAKPPSFHEVVFTVDPIGLRKVEGIFDFSPVDYKKCSKDGIYSGPVSGNGIYFPRYMHSVTASTNYLILPMSSQTFQVCQVLKMPELPPENVTIFNPDNMTSWYVWDASPVVFLLFDKRSKKFLDPIESQKPQFFTHQFTSYDLSEDQVVVDIIASDGTSYDGLTVEHLLHPGNPGNHAYRYTINLTNHAISTRSLLPDGDPGDAEFPQINHQLFEGKQYKYGYAVQFVFTQPNYVVKIAVDDPSGKSNKYFKPGDGISLGEPYYVPRPGSKEEDDGAIVIRGLDVSVNKTRVYVLDAKTMTKIGEILSPTYTPFGLHERFYTRDALGLQPSGPVSSSTMTRFANGLVFAGLVLAWLFQ